MRSKFFGRPLLSHSTSHEATDNNYIGYNDYNFGHQNTVGMIGQHLSQRALQNWSILYRKWMLEYRRHRMRKAAKGIVGQGTKPKTGRRKRPRQVIRMRKDLKWYPWVRFIQRMIKLKLRVRNLRRAVPYK